MRKLVDAVPRPGLCLHRYELRVSGRRDLRARQRVRRQQRWLQLQLPRRQRLLWDVHGQLQRTVRQRQRVLVDGGKQRQHPVRPRYMHAHGRHLGLCHVCERRDLPRHLHRAIVLGVLQRIDVRPQVPD